MAQEDPPIEINVDALTEDMLDDAPQVEPAAPEPEPQAQAEPESEPAAEAAAGVEEDPDAEIDEIVESVPQAAPAARKQVPLSSTIRLERENRRLRREVAQFQAERQMQLEPQPQPEPAQAEPSPFQKWAADNAEELKVDPNLPIPASVMLAEQQWQGQQAERRQQHAAAARQQTDLRTSIAVAKSTFTAEACGDGLDFDTVVAAGAGYLTEADKAIIRAAGSQAGEETYARCLKRARANEVPEIVDALDARRQRRPAARQQPAGPQSAPRQSSNNNRQPQAKAPPTRQQALAARARRPIRAHEALGLGYKWEPDE